MKLTDILILAIIGLLAGIVSGTLGLGGGIVIVPSLVFIMGFSQHMAQGTSLAFLLPPIGFFAAYNYFKQGYVNMKFALILVITFIAGAYLGSIFSMHINDRILRKVFGLVMAVAAVKMIFGK